MMAIRPDAVNHSDELARGLDSNVGGLMRDGRSEGRAGDLLIGARRGIGDLVHVNAAGADGKEEAALDVDDQRLINGRERRTCDRCQRAGLIVARSHGAREGKYERLLKLGMGGGDARCGYGKGRKDH
jgi:hypothetical protein